MIQIRSHTGMRGLAALFVVAYHLQFRSGHMPFEDATTFFRRSYLMVDLFFILSGFIMKYVYDCGSKSIMSVADVRLFLARRIVRIFPLHLIALSTMVIFILILTILYSILGKPEHIIWSFQNLVLLIAQFFLLNAWLPGPNGWNIPSWSISAEFVAYITFPLLVLLFAKTPRATAGALVVFSLAFYLLGRNGISLDITGGYRAPLRCLAGFFIGFVIQGTCGRAAAIGGHTLSIAQFLVIAWIFAVMSMPCNDAWAIPGFACLVALTSTDRGAISRLLGSRPLCWLGDISYAVYITHILVMMIVDLRWQFLMERLALDPYVQRALYLSVAFGAVIFVADFTHRHVEIPLGQHFAKQRLKKLALLSANGDR